MHPRTSRSLLPALLFIAGALFVPMMARAQNTSVHTSFLWHLHQPIYWPDRRDYGVDHYENAWDTIQQQNAGRTEPNESLTTVFTDADRVNAYQWGPADTVGSISYLTNAGAQVNMSGALMENVQSLAAANQFGYAANWYTYNTTALGWLTLSGKPRLDIVNFTYHHAMAPLVSDATLMMELQIQQRQEQIFWGITPGNAPGYFPAETCFSERMIPILNQMGISWTVVANNHLARACPDMPLTLGSGGEMCDIPNKADQINPAQGASNYQTLSIDRGCSPTAAMPFSYQVHTARYVDPNTGAASTITIVPSDQALSWKDSYSTWDLGLISPVSSRNNTSHPALVLLAHDGDNAWSGGYSYYNQWVPQMVSTATSDGYEPTTIQQFLHDFPASPNDIVHVEDGGWVFADSDFGSPSYINWNWPPSYSGSNGVNVVDPSIGTTVKGDYWRAVIATENRVRTAQQMTGITPRTDQVRDPGSYSNTPNSIELAWHYYLAGLDSGFLYYGVADQIKRCVVAQNNVVREIDSTIAANAANDTTGPTIFLPQRHPWNPGGQNFGVQYGYQSYTPPNTDFWVWTYAYDVSGVANVSLKFRIDGNSHPPTQDEFKTYAGGADTGPWITQSMTKRVVASQLSPAPTYTADYYYTKVTGLSDTYVDYYVTGTDTLGNVYNSPIQHVYVAVNQNPVAPGVPQSVSASAISSTQITVTWAYTSGATSYTIYRNGVQVGTSTTNAFTDSSTSYSYTVAASNSAGSSSQSTSSATSTQAPPPPPGIPAGLSGTATSATQVSLQWSAVSGASSYIVKRNGAQIATPSLTNVVDAGLTPLSTYNYTVDAVNISGTSADSSPVAVTMPAADFVMDGVADSPGYLVCQNGMTIYAAIRGTKLYVATWSPSGGVNDHFILVANALLPAATTPAMWAKSGSIAMSSTMPYLGAESTDNYIGWTNAPAGSVCARSGTSGGQMEGVIDLNAAFGSVPSTIYLAAVAYQTADGGVIASQAPAGTGDGNVDPSAFFALPTAAITDSIGTGTFDRLDPARKFNLQISSGSNGNVALTLMTVPGRAYTVEYTSSLSGTWSPLSGTTAASGQNSIIFTDTPSGASPTRFYHVKISSP